MEKKINEQQDRKIIELLTPKHAPECKIKFQQPQRTRTLWSYARIAVAAAAVAAIIAGIILSPEAPSIVEQAQAAANPMEMMSQAFEKLLNQKSFCIEASTIERVRTGLPVTEDGKMVNCKLYYLQGDSTVYMREEWDDEYQTTAIYDKDSMYIWQNGELQKSLEIESRPARYEYLFKSFFNLLHKVDDTSYVLVTEEPIDQQASRCGVAFLDKETKEIPIETIARLQVIKEAQAIELETTPAGQYEPFFKLVYSAEKDKFTSVKIVTEQENSTERKTLMEFKNIIYNYPITMKEITKAPK